MLPMREPSPLRGFEQPFEVHRLSGSQLDNAAAIMHEIVCPKPTLEGAWCCKVKRRW
jgi:hypothetical protein